MVFLRGQDLLLADIEARLRDSTNARWSECAPRGSRDA